MVALWVGIAVLVLAVVLLGGIGYALLGSFQRLRAELAGLTAELEPVLAQARDAAGRVANARE